MVNSAWYRIVANHCLLCGLRAPADLCAACAAELPHVRACCPRCGLPLPVARPCGACLEDPPPYRHCIAPLLYQAPVSQLIARFKYGGQLPCGRLLSELLLRCLRDAPPQPVDMVAPVPLHWRRRWQRGFNQAEVIGDTLARALGLPLCVDLLRRTRPTPPQQGLDAEQRGSNLRGAFATGRGRHDRRLRDQHVALVDDVVTTGATAAEIARVLLAAGAASVQVWCLARTP